MKTVWYRSWTDELLTTEPELPETVGVVNPLASIPGQDLMIDVPPKKQTLNIAEGSGGGVVAVGVESMIKAVTENKHKPMLFEINFGDPE